MAKATTGQSERTRPSSRHHQQNLLESTPILFRLPTVEHHPFRSFEGESTAPTIQQEYTRAQLSHGTTPGTHSTVATTPAIPPVASKIETNEPQVEAPRTWWEHWSSGVVMILLIIAVVTLGIMIFKSSRVTSTTVAATDSNSEFGDLESIQIPSITDGEKNVLAGTAADASIGNQASDFPTETGVAGAVMGPNSHSQLSGSSIPTKNDANEISAPQASLASDLANADVAPFDADSHLGPDSTSPGQGMLPTALQQGSQEVPGNSSPLASATLLQPTPPGVAQQAYSEVPTFPNLAEMNSGDSPSEVAGSLANKPAAGQLGQSPSLYNEAVRQGVSQVEPVAPGMLASDASAMNHQSHPGQSSPNSMQTSSFSMPNLAGSGNASTPSTTPVSVSVQGSNSSATVPLVRGTATPESDEEAIIRAYLELTKGLPQPSSTGADNLNRYQRN